MALIRQRVGPPALNEPLYGLLDVAEVVDDQTAHWRAGIEYDTTHCHDSKLWGEWCVGAGTPAATPVVRMVTITVTGEVTGDPDDQRYAVAVSAVVDGGPVRSIRAAVDTVDQHYEDTVTTGAGPVTVVGDRLAPVTGSLVVSDILTGTTFNVWLEQNADGTIASPPAPLLMAVNEPGIPDDCDGITTVFTAAAGDDPATATVTIAPTTTAPGARPLVVRVGDRRVEVASGATATVPELSPGTYRISVRDSLTWSLAYGWLYIGPDMTGQATLVQSTCPVKTITTPPWQTMTADPFTIYADVSCKSVAFPDAAESALDALLVSQHRAIERVYWDSLIDRATDLAGGQGVSVVRAIAELEQYIATAYNGMGVIHTSAWGVAYLSNAGVLDDTATGDERLRTWRGTPVVVGSGYSREGTPAAVTGEDFWMFITGTITVRHSEVEVFEVLDKATNDLSAIAERVIAVIDDCPTPAVVHVAPGGAA
jgi:hypothetical protein